MVYEEHAILTDLKIVVYIWEFQNFASKAQLKKIFS